ncbi:nucleotide-sugar transporter-domain-containing protein [Fimicolochytrium jonesii]|uniref:nucleotide-sugar transporter-domain-containing protein n=1 Tax=Fimicolochytrium jonesii TaxID=1396493 RepID=UPI0022FDFF96|nr:nucleotide-sugar transporter-domain-containing protein [Fimicolochytrium jonesii]KAI8823047.1 nucleotide-sugar transporter-domain-containing protein [Fimicolochytrium jonesii]
MTAFSTRARLVADSTLFGLPLKWVSLITLVVQNSALALVMSYSRKTRDPDQPPYVVSTAVVMSELIKLIVCAIVYWRQESRLAGGVSMRKVLRDMFGSDSHWKKMTVPAVLYFVQNNLQYVAVQYLDPATFQVTYQMKILTTALFSVLLLGRTLARQKWISLILLTLGIALVQMDGKTSDSRAGGVQQALGLSAVTVACVLSGLAGVWFEKVLKGTQASLFLRNMQLCIFSLIPGFIFGVLIMDGEVIREGGFFQGYNAWTWGAIMCQAIGGLIVALVVKYADNILKGFATSLSIILSSVASMFLFDFEITLMFTLGSSVVLYATHLYGLPERAGQVKRATSYEQPSSDPDPLDDKDTNLLPRISVKSNVIPYVSEAAKLGAVWDGFGGVVRSPQMTRDVRRGRVGRPFSHFPFPSLTHPDTKDLALRIGESGRTQACYRQLLLHPLALKKKLEEYKRRKEMERGPAKKGTTATATTTTAVRGVLGPVKPAGPTATTRASVARAASTEASSGIQRKDPVRVGIATRASGVSAVRAAPAKANTIAPRKSVIPPPGPRPSTFSSAPTKRSATTISTKKPAVYQPLSAQTAAASTAQARAAPKSRVASTSALNQTGDASSKPIRKYDPTSHLYQTTTARNGGATTRSLMSTDARNRTSSIPSTAVTVETRDVEVQTCDELLLIALQEYQARIAAGTMSDIALAAEPADSVMEMDGVRHAIDLPGGDAGEVLVSEDVHRVQVTFTDGLVEDEAEQMIVDETSVAIKKTRRGVRFTSDDEERDVTDDAEENKTESANPFMTAKSLPKGTPRPKALKSVRMSTPGLSASEADTSVFTPAANDDNEATPKASAMKSRRVGGQFTPYISSRAALVDSPATVTSNTPSVAPPSTTPATSKPTDDHEASPQVSPPPALTAQTPDSPGAPPLPNWSFTGYRSPPEPVDKATPSPPKSGFLTRNDKTGGSDATPLRSFGVGTNVGLGGGTGTGTAASGSMSVMRRHGLLSRRVDGSGVGIVAASPMPGSQASFDRVAGMMQMLSLADGKFGFKGVGEGSAEREEKENERGVVNEPVGSVAVLTPLKASKKDKLVLGENVSTVLTPVRRSTRKPKPTPSYASFASASRTPSAHPDDSINNLEMSGSDAEAMTPTKSAKKPATAMPRYGAVNVGEMAPLKVEGKAGAATGTGEEMDTDQLLMKHGFAFVPNKHLDWTGRMTPRRSTAGRVATPQQQPR